VLWVFFLCSEMIFPRDFKPIAFLTDRCNLLSALRIERTNRSLTLVLWRRSSRRQELPSSSPAWQADPSSHPPFEPLQPQQRSVSTRLRCQATRWEVDKTRQTRRVPSTSTTTTTTAVQGQREQRGTLTQVGAEETVEATRICGLRGSPDPLTTTFAKLCSTTTTAATEA